MLNTVPVGNFADEDEVLTNDGLYDIVLDLNVGDWVGVNYDGGKISRRVYKMYSNSNVKINVMHRSGNNSSTQSTVHCLFQPDTDGPRVS